MDNFYKNKKIIKIIKIIILLIVVVIFVVFFYFKQKKINKSSFKNVGNILVIACHIKKEYSSDIISNNLKMIGNENINLIIIVYSTEKGVKFNENIVTDVPIIYIHDKQNKYYDFYKYKLAYDYIKNNDLTFNWIFVTNDSIIISSNVSWIINKIITSDKDYIGILEVSEKIYEDQPYKRHYQSWWLNFKPNAFEYWINHIKFDKSHFDVSNIINDYEINLSNNMINSFNTISLFPLTTNFNGNIFLDYLLLNHILFLFFLMLSSSYVPIKEYVLLLVL